MLTACATADEAESEDLSLFESGTLEQFEFDGQAIDAETDYVVMCMWVSSDNGGLTITPSTEEADQAGVTNLQIDFDHETQQLTGASLRIDQEWVHWEDDGDADNGPTFQAGGPDFSLEGTLADDTRSFEIVVAGSCGTDFD